MIQPKRRALFLAVVPLVLLSSLALSQGPTLKEGIVTTTPGVSPTVKVHRGPIEVVLNLKGTFVASEAHEIVLRPEAWAVPPAGGSLTVLTAVPHGTTVNKGDVLVTLQTDKLDRAIADLEGDQKIAELALKVAREELPVLERSTPIDLAAAERAKLQADEDLKKFLVVDRPQAETAAHKSVKDSEHYLEYAKEELKQLQKMYRNKDLTEETEEIILKRHRHQVESSEFMLKTMVLHRNQVLEIDLPRKEQLLRDTAAKADLALEKARFTLPLTLSQKRLALEKQAYEFQKTQTRLDGLRKDRELMTVRAPAAGIVYHGKYSAGQWNTATVSPRLQRSGTLTADEVFLTIVSPDPVVIHATVEEKDIHWMKKGMKGKAIPVGFPSKRLPVEVASITPAPQAGTFAVVCKVDAATVPEGLLPGMACTVKLTPYHKEAALILPSSVIFGDDDEHCVYQLGGKKISVEVGPTVGEQTEVLSGVKEGSEVLRTKP
jgi:multidrug efflux pump subunit AcrA (membrane-fusion protein)